MSSREATTTMYDDVEPPTARAEAETADSGAKTAMMSPQTKAADASLTTTTTSS